MHIKFNSFAFQDSNGLLLAVRLVDVHEGTDIVQKYVTIYDCVSEDVSAKACSFVRDVIFSVHKSGFQKLAGVMERDLRSVMAADYSPAQRVDELVSFISCLGHLEGTSDPVN